MPIRQTKNDGKWFEEMIEKSALKYECKGILSLRHVDPPTQQIPGTKIIVRKQSPFLDFVGSWTERGGRGIFIEAKTTKEPKLTLDQKDNGVKTTQITMMKHWNMNGAAVGVLWAMDPENVCFVSLALIKSTLLAGTKHLKWEWCPKVKQGTGFILCDFVHQLRSEYP
jgi:penicillin-binding protein-related factor A (putative recombinase)